MNQKERAYVRARERKIEREDDLQKMIVTLTF